MKMNFNNIDIDSSVLSLKLRRYFSRCRSVFGDVLPAHEIRKLRKDIAKAMHASHISKLADDIKKTGGKK